MVERLPFPRLTLAAVVRQLDRVHAREQRAEAASGVDFRQLVQIADEYDLRPRRLGVVEQLGQLPRTGHPGLVENDHAALRQPVLAAEAQVLEQRCEARRLDAGALLELTRRAARHRGADHAVTLGLPGLTRGVERERLAGSSPAADDLHAIALACEPADHRGLLLAERWAAAQRRVDCLFRDYTRALIAPGERAFDQPPLGLEQLGR